MTGYVARGSATLRIRLLGVPDLRHGGTTLPALDSARARSLLAYLLLHRDVAQPRQRLAFLLWPDSTEAQARTNLRHLLHNLRRALPGLDRYLEVTPRALRWRADASFWLDVAAFEESVSRVGDQDADGGVDSLREAVELYRATCWRAATTSGSSASGRGSASATSRPSSAWSRCWRRAATRPRPSCTRSGSSATTPSRRRATGFSWGCTTHAGTGRGRFACTTPARPPWSASWGWSPPHPRGSSTTPCSRRSPTRPARSSRPAGWGCSAVPHSLDGDRNGPA
jgi:hypothetical protein